MLQRLGPVVVVLIVGAAGAWGGGPAGLQPGAYEVEVRLELPHIEGATARQTAIVCLTEGNAAGRPAVLSDNNPLARCPAEERAPGKRYADVRRHLCQGGNAARGSATYALSTDRFHGRIAMKMGGKNMTMAETQSGRRIGACEAAAPRS